MDEHGILDEHAIALLLSVADQLKLPLTNIVRHAELAAMDARHGDWPATHTQAQVALTLVDSYLLGLQLLRKQETLELEPVSISSLLVDSAHELESYAKQHGTMLELHVAGRYGPVMAHRAGLRAALLSLGYALIDSSMGEGKRRALTIATHRTPHGIVAGVYGEFEQLSARAWRTALALSGRAQQPFSEISATGGAGMFVADTIFQAMDTRLRVGRHLNQTGLAVTLQLSQQLSLV